MRASVAVHAGLLLILLACVVLTKPNALGSFGSRRRGGLVLVVGLIVIAAGFNWPVREQVAATERSRLDHFLPRYQFHEAHSIRIEATREKVYRAIREVTADEIFLFRTLTWIRRAGRPLPEGILKPPKDEPILNAAMRTSFRLLAEAPDREIVLGTAVIAPAGWKPPKEFQQEDFRDARQPGFALAAINFRVEDAGPNAVIVTTETRVYATDPESRRKFARYWRMIYPGSALIRRMWLRAIRKRSLSP